MTHYAQSLEIDAKPSAIYAAITTAQGLRAWWTEDCDVGTEVGGTHVFRFGPHRKQFRIASLIPNREVRWHCTASSIVGLQRPGEWVGTEILFRVQPLGQGRSRLAFEHIGLKPELECWDICQDGWRHFLVSLKMLVEGGRGTPYELEEAATHG